MIIYTWNHERHASTLDSWQIDPNSTRIDISLLSSPQALADSVSLHGVRPDGDLPQATRASNEKQSSKAKPQLRCSPSAQKRLGATENSCGDLHVTANDGHGLMGSRIKLVELCSLKDLVPPSRGALRRRSGLGERHDGR